MKNNFFDFVSTESKCIDGWKRIPFWFRIFFTAFPSSGPATGKGWDSGVNKDLRDYGIVFVNGKRVGVLDRRLYQDSLFIDLPKGKVRLDILVENLGRINYGPYLLKNKKGITEKVVLGGKEIKGWQMFKLPMDNVNAMRSKTIAKSQPDVPVVKKGYFTIDKPADTYLDFSNWGKGVVWVNEHNLGRYWEIGPQQTVYVPVEWLKPGKNEIVVLELIRPEQNFLKGIEKPVLNILKNSSTAK